MKIRFPYENRSQVVGFVVGKVVGNTRCLISCSAPDHALAMPSSSLIQRCLEVFGNEIAFPYEKRGGVFGNVSGTVCVNTIAKETEWLDKNSIAYLMSKDVSSWERLGCVRE